MARVTLVMPQPSALLALLAHANDLKNLPRMGWLYADVAQPESVADHSFVTALLVLQLGEAINQDWQTESLEKPLDVNIATQMALVHDLAESLLTDLPKRSAELLGEEVKHRAEGEAMREIFQDLPNGDRYLSQWLDYEQKSTPEARLVKDADRLEMVFQAKRYARRGHTNLAEFWTGHQWYYRATEALFKEIDAQS